MHEHTNTKTTTQTQKLERVIPIGIRPPVLGAAWGIEEWAKPSTMMGKTPSKKKKKEKKRERERMYERKNKCEGDGLVCMYMGIGIILFNAPFSGSLVRIPQW